MKRLTAHLRSVGTPVLYREGSTIFFQGEVPRQAVIVLDGVVRAYTITPDGNETIITLYGKNAILPIAWATNQAANALFNYDAVNDVRALKIPKNELQHLIDENPVFQKEYLEYIAKNQAALLLRITGLCQSRAAEKICYTLYFLMMRYGIPRENDDYVIDLKITQHMLASLIGQTRESTAKNLKTLKEAGVVDYTSATYTVNKPRLEKYLGEDSFRNLELGR